MRRLWHRFLWRFASASIEARAEAIHSELRLENDELRRQLAQATADIRLADALQHWLMSRLDG